ncbi:hypothetical protein C8A05DRAFT_19510 [Staphylotrichum tortipilum]|uniref:Uncharacterized protein n=1 Tax=Staphylotrichum tortipilum TaxID=2831512 RepID=A0AAN6MD26_9PEZI|nr:hypothetical protein C8A05DRAFT_19510 [Staphylotrichum longicolle]
MAPSLFRVPVPILPPLQPSDNTLKDVFNGRIRPREEKGKDKGDQIQIALIILGVVAGLVILGFMFGHFYRKYRRRHTYQPADRDDDSPTTRQIHRQTQNNLEDALEEAQAGNGATNARRQSAAPSANATVDRNQSVRSVMTLPVYRPKAADTELVLGREGERDGIDVVVEMRTAEEEEALRDEEMEAMYQIRAARRRQIADREERRRQRRDAREAHDVVALRELRERAQNITARNTGEIEDLRTEHERIRETRTRAVSSVSYADVGIARADGTRVRANSTESTERVGLLSDTASIAADSLFRRRDRSHSTTLSIDTSRTTGDRPDSPALNTTNTGGSGYTLASANRSIHSRANSAATTPRFPTPSPGTTPRAGSPPEMIDASDAADDDPDLPPPGYDEVSLDEATSPAHSRRNSDESSTVVVSGGAAARGGSPYPDPPPEYSGPGPAEARNNRLSAHVEDLAAQVRVEGEVAVAGSPPRLPSLRLREVPRIVVEPSSANP